MKIGDNIREIREVEKNFKRSYVAERLNMSTRAYANIENNRTDLSMKKLEQIAEIFECSPQYILTYKSSKKEFYNYFHNYPENKGVNIMHQNIETSVGSMLSNKEKIYELQQQLLESEQKRIALLEALLKKNNIDF
ncbi:helix-turn-helix transcriptional regulator [Chitinophaga sp. 212800010-3]|uniref:helix-turn-helix domain-containing protein n=1 Tax=Bacteroidota TaxID=976 RepID=UPI001AC0B8B5|nr:helix-turn-helix transcriptional regulator [Chitinophaga sp. 212800010-3]MBN8880597.1 helix-turn-helix transcriptional regulator [Sphingobacteriales bacterium]MBN9484364.1 helix-turn-helix transcriptional regulator [Bacteroidota bacterium]MEC5143546.1 HTH cro/C1-type domain-containing protein [Chitinophaga sp. 212800010-3]